MSIIEQVKELREYGEEIIFAPKTRDVFIKAADTIESLSEKLQEANMERTKEDHNRDILSETLDWLNERIGTKLKLEAKAKDEVYAYGHRKSIEAFQEVRVHIEIEIAEQNENRSAETCEDMTISEAIKHLDEILQPDRKWDCEECKNEHIQLRKWLVELKGYRKRSADCGGWIPCGERFPAKSGIYEISFNTKDGSGHDFAEWRNGFFCIPADVIAWREHLEPYKPKRED